MGMKVTDTFDEEEKEEGMDWKCGILRCMGPPSTTARDCMPHLEFCLPSFWPFISHVSLLYSSRVDEPYSKVGQ